MLFMSKHILDLSTIFLEWINPCIHLELIDFIVSIHYYYHSCMTHFLPDLLEI